MFCYPEEYTLGIKEMQKGDILEIDTIIELSQLDKKYEKYIQEV